MEMIRRVRQTIKKYSMISPDDHILIGLSGGPDSVCLAIILDKLREDFNLSLSALYIDHGLRPEEAGNEKDFCEGLCNKLGISFHFRTADVKTLVKDEGLNLQEAARELRYGLYEEITNRIQAGRTALGHTADDQAETVLMRLFSGSGRKGLTGIPPVRGRIIRPLIEIERKEIEEFLLQNAGACCNTSPEPPFMVDSSNLREDYFRNWIRLSIVEEIRKRNPSVVRDICRTAEIFREEEDYLDVIVTKTLMRLISRKGDNTIELFLAPLVTLERALLRRVLRRAINAVEGLRGISFVHIEDIIKLIKSGSSGDSIHLPGDIRVIKDYALLKITAEKPVSLSSYDMQPPCEIVIKEAGISLKASFEKTGGETGDGRSSILLDAGRMTFPLRIRGRNAGDFFYPLGFGKRKKLQDFFVDEKIPREERDRVPIVTSGNDIIWIAGYRADERFKVTGQTKTYVKLIISNLKK